MCKNVAHIQTIYDRNASLWNISTDGREPRKLHVHLDNSLQDENGLGG